MPTLNNFLDSKNFNCNDTFLTNSVLDAAFQASSGDGQQVDPYCLVFMLLLDAMDIRQQTVTVQAKQLSDNAAMQELKNLVESQYTYIQIPEKATQDDINRIQAQNQQISAQKANIQNQIITLRQNGQVEMTSVNSNVNTLEQEASQNSAWVNTLGTILQLIGQMGKPQ